MNYWDIRQRIEKLRREQVRPRVQPRVRIPVPQRPQESPRPEPVVRRGITEVDFSLQRFPLFQPGRNERAGGREMNELTTTAHAIAQSLVEDLEPAELSEASDSYTMDEDDLGFALERLGSVTAEMAREIELTVRDLLWDEVSTLMNWR